SPVSGAVILNDIDGDALTASLATAPTNGTVIVNTDGTYTYTPTADFNGTDTFTVSVDDGNGGTDTATVTITVNPQNDAPTAADDAVTTNEDSPVSGAVIVNDIDGDA
ncbi:cadherin-like domain-containing protein, partial [Ahrensia sp. R2A130]|uniref:cadherin-like domain-containing protein n=1 Tax=Ahrensia sp. R2A130 TaxID=744979 RepID=UPI0001E0D8B4